VKFLVVDDEVLARQRLLRLLSKLHPDGKCLEAEGGEQALALIPREQPDVILLDIRMPGIDGIAVAEQLEDFEQPPAIVFCTAYDEYALEALQHEAVAYLLKPVREADLQKALASAGRVNRVQLAKLREDEGRTQVSSQGQRGVETLPVADIRCFTAGQKYVTAHAPQRELLLPDTLKDLEEEFGQRFLRVHRNALVALAHVVRLTREAGGWVVELADSDLRPAVSRRHLAEVKEALTRR